MNSKTLQNNTTFITAINGDGFRCFSLKENEEELHPNQQQFVLESEAVEEQGKKTSVPQLDILKEQNRQKELSIRELELKIKASEMGIK